MRKEQRRGRKIFLPVERYMTERDGNPGRICPEDIKK
jgi:hypothetical protein